MPVTILHTRDGRLDESDAALLADLATRLKDKKAKVLLFLHGGLVNEADGMAAANRLSGKGPTSFNAPSDWEQVYVVWRTGALETLRTNWKDLFDNDRLYRTLLKRLISFVSGHVHLPPIDGRAIVAGEPLTPAEVERRLLSGGDHPFEDFDVPATPELVAARAVEASEPDFASLRVGLERDRSLQAVAADVEAALAPPHLTDRSLEDGDAVAGRRILDHIDNGVAAPWHARTDEGRSIVGISVLKSLVQHGINIAKRVIQRYREGHDHGLQATVVEEIIRELYGDLIGSIIWGMMKTDAADHFKAGALGSGLLEAVAANEGGELLVVGHSAGSIWASEMLIAMGRGQVQFPLNLVFLAPAVRTGKFAEALEASGGSIERFRMYTMHDQLERADVLLGKGTGFLYPSSLLYIVSGLFEDSNDAALPDAPLLGMERHIWKQSTWLSDPEEGPPIEAIQSFLANPGDRLVLSVSKLGAGLDCDANSHGGFDDNPETLASVATFF